MKPMSNNKIIVIVDGGVIQDVVIPKALDATVEVRDYDIDGADEANLSKDDSGEECVISTWKNATVGTGPLDHINKADWSVNAIIDRQYGEPVYLTNGLCESAHGSEELFDRLRWVPYTFETSPGNEEFYPLDANEMLFISEDCVDTPEGPALLGYSCLYKNEKWLMPNVEICFLDGEDRPFSEESYGEGAGTYKTSSGAWTHCIAYSRKIRPAIEAIGGHVLLSLDASGTDRHTVQILIPPLWAINKFGTDRPFEQYKAWLATVLNPQG